MKSATPLIADELVECIAGGSTATSEQLSALATRIWREASQHRSAFSWGDAPAEKGACIFAARSAALALNGDEKPNVRARGMSRWQNC